MDVLIAILTGIGLAAACGFRVFVPLFLVSLAMNAGVDMPLGLDSAVQTLMGDDMAWLGQPAVTTGLGVATVVEVGGFYIPWVDNLLDVLAAPLAVSAGTFMSGAMMPELFGDGAMKWAIALMAGGGSSGVVQFGTALARGTSTATTAGLANPLVATFELISSILTTLFAVLIPILVIAVLVGVVLFLRKIFRDDPDDGDGEDSDSTLQPGT
jgi:hypothetical protein